MLTLGLLVSSVSAENLLYSEAKKAGIKKCLPTIEKIGNFIIEDAKAGTHSVWRTNKPDTTSFTAVIERNYTDGSTLTNVVVAPTSDGQCYMEYEQVYHMNKPCIAAAQEIEGGKYNGTIHKNVSVIKKGEARFYLITNSNECTVIKKEVIFDGNNP